MGLEVMADTAGTRLLLVQHDQNGRRHVWIEVQDHALRFLDQIKLSSTPRLCGRGAYDDGEDWRLLSCERATARTKKPRGRTRGRNVTNLLATPGITTLCPCIRAAYPAAAMSAGVVLKSFYPGSSFIPARAWNSVGTTPGHNVVTRIPWPDSS